MPIIVGLISDTHGLLRPAARDAMVGSDFIIHAGDIGNAEILSTLAGIAPVTVVRGNVDTQPWTRAIPKTELLDAGGARIHVVHDISDLDCDPAAAGFQAVVYGHSHQPVSRMRDGVLHVNPGSAGPRRFSRPISVGRLVIHDGTLSAELIDIR